MAVLSCGDIKLDELRSLLGNYGLIICIIENNKDIPGSWFGDSEAGLIDNQLYIRMDTPVHSALHESCHYVCMDATRRKTLNTNAGGDYTEENGVCYLQIILADYITGFGRDRALNDMDEWGYTFRLGSSRAWFEQDADDAQDWLLKHHIIDKDNNPTWMLRN